jgi:lysozyme
VGIDVSHYQGDVDWARVSAAGVSFAIAKATEGEAIVDSAFEANWRGMSQAGLARGAYHFFRPTRDPLKQAKSFVKTVGQLKAGDLPPALDVEVADGASATVILDGIAVWVAHVEGALKAKPMIYTRASFWKAQCDDSDRFAGYPLWIAHYTTADEPRLPNAWEGWTLWQHSEKGSISGVKGPVDLNRSQDTLRQLAQAVIGSLARRRRGKQRRRRRR